MQVNSGSPENADSPDPSAPADPLDDATAGLAAAVLEIARESAEAPGGILPAPRWFALVATAALLRAQPAFRAVLDAATLAQAEDDPHHLTPIELEGTSSASDPLEALAGVDWPDIAVGAAVACDLPAEHWAERSPAEATVRGSGTLRAVVAARADGTTWCAVRVPDRDDYALGHRLVPDLADALAESISAEG